MASASRQKPSWLKISLPSGSQFTHIKQTLRKYDLHTVCEEAHCPNIGECWSGKNAPGTATFMLMGDRCSRTCNFCNVTTGGMLPLDPDEPLNIASAISELNLEYAVLTSVNRDDLPDQGAEHFAKTIDAIRNLNPDTLIETLIPDFQCDFDSLDKIISAKFSAPGLESPTAFIQPPPLTLKIVGLGYPSQGSLLRDLVTTPPAPALCNLWNTSKEIPSMPEAKMVGLSKVRLPIEVERLGFNLIINNRNVL